MALTFLSVFQLSEKINGEPCEGTIECLFDGSGCIDDTCACPQNTYEDGTMCLASMNLLLLS